MLETINLDFEFSCHSDLIQVPKLFCHQHPPPQKNSINHPYLSGHHFVIWHL